MSIGSKAFLAVLLLCGLINVNAIEYSRADEGFPAGFISTCFGSEKNVTVSKNILSKLYVGVYATSPNIGTYQKNYRLNQVQAIAADRHINFRRKTVLFISGWLDTTQLFFSKVFGDVYSPKNYNVLVLDTARFTTYIYPIAARLSRVVGEKTARMLVRLTKLGLRPEDIEVVGLSLGGQTISFVGKAYYRLTGRKLSRLTGLDPSSPCFRTLPPTERLDSTDADFVDVIHTNIDGYGIATPVGHVNFYVNGGEYQPSGIQEMPCLVLCSHIRALFVWLASVEYPDDFIGIKCDSIQQARDWQCFDRVPLETNIMGPKSNSNATGIFYIGTTNSFPYYMGRNGLDKNNEVFKKNLLQLNSFSKLAN